MLNKIDWEHAKLVTIENVRKNEDISNFFPLKRELIIDDKIEIVDDAEKAVVGTSTKLEKSYFRLTSAVDESSVRPLRVLERAFVHCIGKYEKTKDYLWVRDQLKAIRQDLKVSFSLFSPSRYFSFIYSFVHSHYTFYTDSFRFIISIDQSLNFVNNIFV